MKQRNSTDTPWRAAGLVSAIGVDLVVCVVGGFYLGQFARDRLNGSPLWLAAGVVLGLLVGVVSIVFMIKFHLRGSR
ncbi:AtpZ/AtpI family protein [Paenibacillus turpanensis]|uniref:AtpZ/AtpI family protein n=1 Tax=Paenibacillus turpanensis TaxID=2689078 RepID=UPI00140CB3C9|nr:AtpZ/AtpI family protein [Paenibacillus turpanensis]